jgi:hypothetical protein
MAEFAEVRVGAAPPQGGGAQRFIRWLCTSNPFYVLSAALFLAGLWISFGGQTQAEETWALMSGLAGYTLLLAVTAFLLVRFCKVWDDVRTVLLLVVLMFLATSVTFDELLVLAPRRGFACYLLGLAFAVAVSEGLLRGLRLVLPAWFRAPYYLLLALFFLYPLALSPLLDRPRSEGLLVGRRTETLMWGLFGFSSAAALIFLTLLPAIRRGQQYTRDNGSPWRWPLYPWVLFGVLAFAVPGRAFLLCYSLDLLSLGQHGRVIFGPYFLVPFGLASAILILEIGLVSSRRVVLWAALAAPVGLVMLALLGHRPDPIYQGFLRMFTARLGAAPLFLTLGLSAGFYAYAALRRVPLASGGLTVVLAALAVVGSHSLSLGELVAPRPVPILAAGALQMGLGLWRRSAGRGLLGAAALAVGGVLALPPGADVSPFREVIAFHLGLTAVFFVGAVFDSALARRLRIAGPALGLLSCLAVLFVQLDFLTRFPPWAVEAYPPAMTAWLGSYALLLNSGPTLVFAALALAAWLAATGARGYGSLRQVVAGLDYLALSLALFALALLVSLGKSGILSRWLAARLHRVSNPSE